MKPHTIAVLQALLVTFLWSTSWVLIKFGLVDIPPLTFAGLRYALAFLILLPFTLSSKGRRELKSLSSRQWGLLLLLGLLFYAVVQGSQFFGLAFLPAATVSLILGFTTLVVALMGVFWLAEQPGWMGWLGITLSMIGAVVYFYPVELPGSQYFALFIVTIGMLANAVSAVLGRSINQRENIPPLIVTTVSMGFGAALLLAAGTITQGIPYLTAKNWIIILWLALVNTAFAFTLWNHTLRSLPAMESSIINSTMLVQIALLAWLVLGEALTYKEWLGLLLVGAGVLVVQLRLK
jgi:drug/metabolite transporter (DMT)-like permease